MRYLLLILSFLLISAFLQAEEERPTSTPQFTHNPNVKEGIAVLHVHAPVGTELSYTIDGVKTTWRTFRPNRKAKLYYIAIDPKFGDELPTTITVEIPGANGKRVRASTGRITLRSQQQTTIQFKLSIDREAARVLYWSNIVHKVGPYFDRPRSMYHSQIKEGVGAFAVRAPRGTKISLIDERGKTHRFNSVERHHKNNYYNFAIPDGKKSTVVEIVAESNGQTVKTGRFTLHSHSIALACFDTVDGKLMSFNIDPREAVAQEKSHRVQTLYGHQPTKLASTNKATTPRNQRSNNGAETIDISKLSDPKTTKKK